MSVDEAVEKAHDQKGKLNALNAVIEEIDGEKVIVYLVPKKKLMADLKPEEVAPEEIDGVTVKVRELKPQGWDAGITSVSEKSPLEQRMLASGVAED